MIRLSTATPGFEADFTALLNQAREPTETVDRAVATIVADVRERGDIALIEYTSKFDRLTLTPDRLRIGAAEIESAAASVSPDAIGALDVAARRIEAFHQAQLPADLKLTDDAGMTLGMRWTPLDSVGLYVPGGKAAYPSSVLMNAMPARVAGVRRIAMCVPTPDGVLNPLVLAAARRAGVSEIYRVGGAQAVAALAYGTESVTPVDRIVGPGNAYVAEAKRQVSGGVGVASALAGPSEVVVIAGPDTPSELAAIDLVVQAEHGPDGLAWLITWSEELIDRVDAAVDRIVAASPRRSDLEATLGSGGYAVLVDGPKRACAVSNVVAPEHLEILTDDAASLLSHIDSAGAVFLGTNAPASIGDYLAGPTHVLPTNRTARFASALRVDDFRKHIHAVSLTDEAVRALGPHVETLAETEGLPAHAQSVRLRWPG